MAARKAKSKKRSSGKKPSRPLKGFTLYLCQNVDFDELAEALDKANIRYQRHRDHFQSWVDDTVLLPLVGRKGWILITTDQRQRTRHIENQKIRQYRVREFVFAGGSLGAQALCTALIKAKNKMRKLCRASRGPFIASISRSGDVRLRTFVGS
jgi:hypothetical protein